MAAEVNSIFEAPEDLSWKREISESFPELFETYLRMSSSKEQSLFHHDIVFSEKHSLADLTFVISITHGKIFEISFFSGFSHHSLQISAFQN